MPASPDQVRAAVAGFVRLPEQTTGSPEDVACSVGDTGLVVGDAIDDLADIALDLSDVLWRPAVGRRRVARTPPGPSVRSLG